MRSEPPHDPAELPRLILSIQDIFAAKKVERLTTTELCDALNKEEEGGWAQIDHGRGVDAYWLREKLADVVPNDEGWEKKRRWTVGGKKRHGYTRAHFDDAIKRYLPREASKTVESSGPSGPIEEKADRSMTSADRMARAGSKNGESRSGPSGPGDRATGRMDRMQNDRDPIRPGPSGPGDGKSPEVVRPNGPDGPDQNPEMEAPAREGVPLRGARRRRDPTDLPSHTDDGTP